MRCDESYAPTSTPPAAIRAFRSRHALSPERCAALLELAPETFRLYEETGGAPPWVGYALMGLDYQQLGAVPECDVEPDAARAAGRPFYAPPAPSGPAPTAGLAR